MTRRSFVVAALAIATVIAVPSAQVNLNGDWVLTIDSPQGIIDSDASFQVEGDQVTGYFSGPTGEASVTGTLDGSALTLNFSISTGQGIFDVKMTAEVDGDEMKGVMDFGMGTADVTGRRKEQVR